MQELEDARALAGGWPQREDENIVGIENGDLPVGLEVGAT